MDLVFQHGADECRVGVDPGADAVRITLLGRTHRVVILRRDGGRLELEVDGRRVVAHVASAGDVIHVHVEGQTLDLRRSTGACLARPSHGQPAEGADLLAPMPGQVRAVLVQDGDRVASGQPLVLLEAMKMELKVRAPGSGRVKRVECRAGDVVERGQLLVALDAG